MSDTVARFHEGPEGRREWEAWLAEQPAEVQEDWEQYNEKHKDKFKSASVQFMNWIWKKPSALATSWSKFGSDDEDVEEPASSMPGDGQPQKDAPEPTSTEKQAMRRERLTWKEARGPSEDDLLELDPHGELDDRGFDTLVRIIDQGTRDPYKALAKADKLLSTFGVDETDSGVMYLNTGDMYNATLAYVEDEDRFVVTTLGDIRQGRFASRQAASGLYGYTKRTQKDVQAAINRVRKKSRRIARDIWAEDEQAARFLQAHAERSDSLSAKILLSAMKDLSPRVATSISEPWQDTVKGASKRSLYGFPQATARLGLTACADLRDHFGQEASNLHARRASRYDRITSFLKDHSKHDRCKFSQLLLRCYPLRDMKVASGEPWITWDE